MKHKTIFAVFAAFLLIALAGCTQIDGQVVAEPELEKVSLRLPAPVTADAHWTQYYTSQARGYYADEGLDVQLYPGSAETNPVKMVLSGADDFGLIGGPDTLLIARSKGIPLVAVATWHKNSNFPVLVTLKDSGITTVEQLEGKKIGMFYGHISTDTARHLLNSNGISYEEVNTGFDYSQLISGKVDAEVAFRTYAPILLPLKGVEVNAISPADYGISTHGLTLFVTEDMIENNPELVEKFLRATVKGTRFMLDNPEQALIYTIEQDPETANADIERQKLYPFIEPILDTAEHPVGYIEYEMFKETYDRLKEENLLESEFDVRDAYTTEFIDRINS